VLTTHGAPLIHEPNALALELAHLSIPVVFYPILPLLRPASLPYSSVGAFVCAMLALPTSSTSQ
jgi:hypothetical protein